MEIGYLLERLVNYGLDKNLIENEDQDYVRNRLLSVLKLKDCAFPKVPDEKLESPVSILEKIVDWAVNQELLPLNTVTYRDQLDTAIMNCLIARPSEINQKFNDYYKHSPQKATSYFYKLSKDSHYIRTDRIAKNEHWLSNTEYGALEITINLSKPEKDPSTIAAEKNAKSSNYPLCLLCKENVGYEGRMNHPARQSHRIIPVELTNKKWYFQFSPYVYYHEHAIIFSGEHEEMKISEDGFNRLLDFVSQYPHYFAGSNADLPIVGGSILSHDHFQGGNHDFPMAKARVESVYNISGFEEIQVGIVKWPMSVIRLIGSNKEKMAELAGFILEKWKSYSDDEVEIRSHTLEQSHNTITPIARMKNELYELDLVLRNNRTSEKHPLGIFHPHEEVHHVKKENIGLIEVMGLAVLPGRLQEELNVLARYILNDHWEQASNDELTLKHVQWAKKINRYDKTFNEKDIQEILRKNIGIVFSKVLEHAGVFKRTQEGKKAFDQFIKFIGGQDYQK